MSDSKKISIESYKGVRDFYPADQAIQNHIFDMWRKTVMSFGYEEYNASVLESAELYRAKSGEEIVNEQTYTFKDRGDREVTLRPEMTPTVARMVAAKKRELAFPLRWYSIPNLFRYEQPQKGRLREHWQLNVDIFGVDNTQAEVEIIQIAAEIMRNFGVKDSQFEIRVNSRKIMNYVLFDVFKFDEEKAHRVSKLIDKKAKLRPEQFVDLVKEIVAEQSDVFLTLINSKNFEEFTSRLPQTKEEHLGIKEVREVMAELESLGVKNTRFDQTLMRGFDYYTGIVFEVFDLNPENRRSVFGGGRYDDLLGIFGNEKLPAVGFGTGDVVMRDLLLAYNLLPSISGATKVYICPLELKYAMNAQELAQKFREHGVRAAVDFTERKIGDKIKGAEKRGIPYVVCIGSDEISSGKFKLKNLAAHSETEFTEEELVNEVSKA